MELNKTHLRLLSYLRKDSRQSFSDMAKKTKIPTSTLFDYYWFLREQRIIKKNTSLLNFKKLNYSLRLFVFLKVKEKSKLLRFLQECRNTNSISRLNNFDFSFEIFFQSVEEMETFFRKLNQFGIIKMQKHHVLEELKQEDFLCSEVST